MYQHVSAYAVLKKNNLKVSNTALSRNNAFIKKIGNKEYKLKPQQLKHKCALSNYLQRRTDSHFRLRPSSMSSYFKMVPREHGFPEHFRHR
jgi:hypothetical protein